MTWGTLDLKVRRKSSVIWIHDKPSSMMVVVGYTDTVDRVSKNFKTINWQTASCAILEKLNFRSQKSFMKSVFLNSLWNVFSTCIVLSSWISRILTTEKGLLLSPTFFPLQMQETLLKNFVLSQKLEAWPPFEAFLLPFLWAIFFSTQVVLHLLYLCFTHSLSGVRSRKRKIQMQSKTSSYTSRQSLVPN